MRNDHVLIQYISNAYELQPNPFSVISEPQECLHNDWLNWPLQIVCIPALCRFERMCYALLPFGGTFIPTFDSISKL